MTQLPSPTCTVIAHIENEGVDADEAFTITRVDSPDIDCKGTPGTFFSVSVDAMHSDGDDEYQSGAMNLSEQQVAELAAALNPDVAELTTAVRRLLGKLESGSLAEAATKRRIEEVQAALEKVAPAAS